MSCRLLSVAIALAAVGCVGTPHHDPAEITSVEVSVYKAGIDKGCRDAGRGRDPESKTDAFCSCVLATLNSRLSQEEWQRATFYAQQRRDKEEKGVLAPHMPAVESCRRSV